MEVNCKGLILSPFTIFWVPNFVDWTKITHLWGSKFVAFIIQTENRFFLGTRFRGLDPPRKPRKIGTPQKIKPSTVHRSKWRNWSLNYTQHVEFSSLSILHVFQDYITAKNFVTRGMYEHICCLKHGDLDINIRKFVVSPIYWHIVNQTCSSFLNLNIIVEM